mmetsp:Transcript_20062/g.63066  ORF Transcript_20062/g.63066 Transcript_20062/m.63066 type:complete len:1006 (-) Transcript_20062:337-3354(-)
MPRAPGRSRRALVAVLSTARLSRAVELAKRGEILVDNEPHGIRGISGVCYDGEIYYSVDEARPYVFAMALDFEASAYRVLNRSEIDVGGVRFGDCAVQRDGGLRLWTVSETNDLRGDGTRAIEPTYPGSAESADLTNLDKSRLTQDRFIAYEMARRGERVSPDRSAALLFPRREFEYDKSVYRWDRRRCRGSRPFSGANACSLSPAGDRLVAAEQTALFQDGAPPTYYDGSRTRILLYDVVDAAAGVDGVELVKTLNYRVEPVHARPPHAWATHWSAIVGITALDLDHLLVLEVSFVGEKRTRARIFELEPAAVRAAPDVSRCRGLDARDCGDTVVAKRLVLDLNDVHFDYVDPDDTLEWDGMTLGETLADGAASLVVVNDVDAGNRRGSGGTRPIDLDGDSTDGTVYALFALNLTADSGYSATDFRVDREAPKARAGLGAGMGALGVVLFFAASWYCGLGLLKRYGFYVPRRLDDVEPHMLKLVAGLLRSFIFGGIAFGWPAMQLLAHQRGVYGELCVCGFECSSMRSCFAYVNSIGFALAVGSRLFWGLVLDKLGPKVTSVCGLIIAAFGFYILSTMGDRDHLFLLGWSFLASAGPAVHVSNLHLLNLFPTTKHAVSAAFAIVLTGSSLIFPMLQLVFQAFSSRATYKFVMWNLGNVALGFTAHAACVQPWKAYAKLKVKTAKDDSTTTDETISRFPRWVGSSRCCQLVSVLTTYKPSERLHGIPVKDQIRTFEFLAEALFFSLGLLLVQLYLGTITNQLFFKGDRAAFSAVPAHRTDFAYTKLAGFVNGAGGLWYPWTAYLLEDGGYAVAAISQCLLATTFHLVLLLPHLPLMVFAMLAHAGARNLLFSLHASYLSTVFGTKTFGLLDGISCLLAAVVCLASYPLQLFAIFDLDGRYASLNIAGAVVSASLTLFPILLASRDAQPTFRPSDVPARLDCHPIRGTDVVLDVIHSDLRNARTAATEDAKCPKNDDRAPGVQTSTVEYLGQSRVFDDDSHLRRAQ